MKYTTFFSGVAETLFVTFDPIQESENLKALTSKAKKFQLGAFQLDLRFKNFTPCGGISSGIPYGVPFESLSILYPP